jgi:Asp-tRNA(Asn)/Glu-tRNA(Gln) amidotransferase A subunit family amidase
VRFPGLRFPGLGHHAGADLDTTTHRIRTLDDITLKVTTTVLDRHYRLWGRAPGNLPGISLPMGTHANGLPPGVQVVSRQADDGLPPLAAQAHRAQDGKRDGWRMPRIHVTHA